MAAKKESATLQDQLNILFAGQLFEETEKRLVFGSVFLIPDEISGIPSGKRKKGKTRTHPFVVIRYFRKTSKLVLCALRTTDLQRQGLLTSENILPGLDKPGVIVLDERFRFGAQLFVNFDHLGMLPANALHELKLTILKRGWL